MRGQPARTAGDGPPPSPATSWALRALRFPHKAFALQPSWVYHEVMTSTAPLENFRVVGVTEKVWQACPGAPTQPAGTCWHCGTSILVCVQAQNRETGEVVDIGTTCAERIGLDPAGLKQYLAERFAEQRAARRAADAEARRAAHEQAELEAAGLLGAHGTESRFLSGCYCKPCLNAAPHGTMTRFNYHGCHCDLCIAEALNVTEKTYRGDEHLYTIRDRDVLIDLETGEVMDAKVIETRYGMSWICNGRFFPVDAKRRSTYEKRGVTVAEVPTLVEICRGRKGTWYKEICRMSEPTVDIFGVSV